MKFDRKFLTFVGVAAVQAVANYGTYLLVLQVAPWYVAFACAAVVGIALQTLLQIRATFGTKLTYSVGWRYIAYQVVYLAIFTVLLATAISAGILPSLAPLAVLIVIAPVNFLLSRWIITRPGSAA